MFVEINGRILDLNKLKREQLLIKKIIEREIDEILKKYGFEKEKWHYFNDRVLLTCQARFKSTV